MLRSPNPNERSNAEVLRPWMNGWDITRRPRNMWIIDFGEMPLEEACLFEAPFEYLKKNIKPIRERNRDYQRKTYWWRLGRSGCDLKEAAKNKKRAIVTPRVSKHRLFIWASHDLLPDSATVAIARDDDYFFGVLHSKPHELWARGMGTQLREVESGFRYTPTTTFETFPFPWSPGKEPKNDPRVKAIAKAARELVEERDNWLNPPDAPDSELKKRTLTNLYNERPTWLELAHKRLDDAVLDAYGWQPDLSEDEILARLLELNLKRAKT
jgi:type II restriction/modification system DNA methylase subunit YeeA